MTPFVTIGIPTYNVGSFIGMSIKSVLNQTYTNFELIITDDGSTDNTVEEIKKINDPRIKLIVDRENHGISYRLNQQIGMAMGEIFVRMDGDDLMFPNRIEEQVKYLKENSEVDVVGTGAIIIDNDNNIIGQRMYEIELYKPEDTLTKPIFIHPTVAGKISFFRKYKYDEALCGVEDKDLWCRGLIDGKYALISKYLIFYRDPLQLKFSTYQKRKITGCKQVMVRWKLYNSKKPALLYIFDAITKIFGAYILCKLGKESKFIAMRNNYTDNAQIYQVILDCIVK